MRWARMIDVKHRCSRSCRLIDADESQMTTMNPPHARNNQLTSATPLVHPLQMMRMTLFASAMVATAMAGGCSSGQCSPFGLCNGQRVDIATFAECETAAAHIQGEASSQIVLLNDIVGNTPQCTMALQHVLKAAKALTNKKSGGRYLQERGQCAVACNC